MGKLFIIILNTIKNFISGAEKIKCLEGCLALAMLWHNALPPEMVRKYN